MLINYLISRKAIDGSVAKVKYPVCPCNTGGVNVVNIFFTSPTAFFSEFSPISLCKYKEYISLLK